MAYETSGWGFNSYEDVKAYLEGTKNLRGTREEFILSISYGFKAGFILHFTRIQISVIVQLRATSKKVAKIWI